MRIHQEKEQHFLWCERIQENMTSGLGNGIWNQTTWVSMPTSPLTSCVPEQIDHCWSNFPQGEIIVAPVA